MEGFGNRLSPLHFLMSAMVVLPRRSLTLKFLQSSIVLTLSDSGINSTQRFEVSHHGREASAGADAFLLAHVLQGDAVVTVSHVFRLQIYKILMTKGIKVLFYFVLFGGYKYIA